MIPPRAICALMIVVLTGTQSSCRRSGTDDLISRLNSAKRVEAEFESAVRALYPTGSKVPKLSATLSRDGHLFTLTAANEKDVDRIGPSFARLLKQEGVKSASLVLIGSEFVSEGKAFTAEGSKWILGGYRIHDDGVVKKVSADALMADSTKAASDLKQAD